MRTTLPSDTESAIWDRVLQPIENKLSPEGASALLLLAFSSEDKKRMHKLAAKARAGTLTTAEQQEISNYETVGNVLGLMKAIARQSLKTAAHANGPSH